MGQEHKAIVFKSKKAVEDYVSWLDNNDVKIIDVKTYHDYVGAFNTGKSKKTQTVNILVTYEI